MRTEHYKVKQEVKYTGTHKDSYQSKTENGEQLPTRAGNRDRTKQDYTNMETKD